MKNYEIFDVTVMEVNGYINYLVELDSHDTIDMITYITKDGKVKKVNVAYINGEYKTLKRITEFYKNVYEITRPKGKGYPFFISRR